MSEYDEEVESEDATDDYEESEELDEDATDDYEPLDENEELENETDEELENDFEPLDETDELEDEIENDFDPRDEYEDLEKDKEELEDSQDNPKDINEITKDNSRDGLNNKQYHTMRLDVPPGRFPPEKPKVRRQKEKNPRPPKKKGKLIDWNRLKKMLPLKKRKKKIFTKNVEELKEELTTVKYKELKYKKHK